VRLSKEELTEASSDVLQSQEAETRAPLYVIDILPPVEEDFPHLSGEKTNVYPLPISHENQCKIVGVASNLDLFANEFGFKTNKAKKYLPLKQNGKEFDLDRAYGRYAFIKSLEQHKLQQSRYEQILRHPRDIDNEQQMFDISSGEDSENITDDEQDDDQ
jgi:hypothetical protein